MFGAIGNMQHLQIFQSGYATQGAVNFNLVPKNQQHFLHSYSMFNASASAIDMGLGIGLSPSPSVWRLYQHGVTDTDVTVTIQAGSAVTLFDTTAGHGFMVEAQKKFGLLVIKLSQAQTGSPVYVYEYWNGTSWTTLSTSSVGSYTSTGFTYVVFNPPADWATGDGGLGINTGYAMRVRATTAPSQAVLATSLVVGRWIVYRQLVSPEQQLQVVFQARPLCLDSGETLQPYFGAAGNNNTVEASFQAQP